MIEETDLGISLPLTSEIADKLRNFRAPSSNNDNDGSTTVPQQPKLCFLKKSSPGEEDNDDDLDAWTGEIGDSFDQGDHEEGNLLLSGQDPLDNWNDVLPAGEDPLEATAEGEEAAPEADEDKETPAEEEEDDDDVSLSPPPSMPVVVVDLKRLVGHVPSSHEESQQLEDQIRAALWYGSTEAAESNTPDSSGNPQEDNRDADARMEQILVAAQHFDTRVTELMENGVARHDTTTAAAAVAAAEDTKEEGASNDNDASTNTEQTTPKQHIQIAYPDFLCSPKNEKADNIDYTPRQVMATSHMWKRLLRTHSIPVVASLLKYLQTCHRSLVWKHAMHQELWELAKSEEQARTRRHQAKALREWKEERRSNQLEQLYQVRETLEHRWEMAKDKVKELKAVRDQAVKKEIRRRRYESTSGGATGLLSSGGLEAFDLNSTILAFPDANDTTWMGLEDDDDDAHYDDQVGASFVSDSDDDDYDSVSDGSGYDAEGDAEEDNHSHINDTPSVRVLEGTVDGSDEDALQATMPSFPKRDTKARREALAKKRRRRLAEAAKEAEHQTKLDKARSEEVRMRDMFTTNDLKMSQAIAAAVEKKLESVDELLESLQEETWEDEETQESGKALVPAVDDGFAGAASPEEFTLLDQILAMILGAFPPPPPADGENAGDVVARHTQGLQKEHARIVKEWRVHFGRLPSSLVSETPAAPKDLAEEASQGELRSAYGIVENDENDWDKEDSDEDVPVKPLAGNTSALAQAVADTLSIAEPPAPSPRPPPRLGLRPGGRAQR